MKRPHLRISLRRMMILVAIVAVLMGCELMRRQRAACLERLAWLAGRERMLKASDPEEGREIASPYLKHGKQMGVGEALEEIARQRRRYEYAASHPWLPVEPDPPGPE
jgi:hypothetical protein